jgi:hypothetical protein
MAQTCTSSFSSNRLFNSCQSLQQLNANLIQTYNVTDSNKGAPLEPSKIDFTMENTAVEFKNNQITIFTTWKLKNSESFQRSFGASINLIGNGFFFNGNTSNSVGGHFTFGSYWYVIDSIVLRFLSEKKIQMAVA